MTETLPQTLRDGRYAVIRLLGEGAQGATLEAVDKRDGKLVAIKRFRVRGAKSWKEVELAEREARVLASIAHPALPRYVEHFEEAGELFLVTEKIEGEDLLSLRKRGVSTSEAEVIRLLRDASSALDYLHGRAPPVIHRDIKPSNVMRRPDGSYALIDFGAVRDRMKPEGGSTVVGTFGFMAPEQFQGRAMPATDVYAVGATALSMLTGREPEDLPHKGLAIDVRAALGAGSGASPAMIQALSAMLEPDPDKRAGRIAPLLSRFGAAADPPAPVRGRAPPFEPPRQGKRERRRDERDEKHARKEAKREAKYARSEAEREARRLQEEWANWGGERWKHAQAGRRGPLVPGPILLLVMIGLTIAQVAVNLVLRGAIPVVFTILSVFFGKSWREAARNVSKAGKVAVDSMERARAVVSGHAAPGASGSTEEGIRVDARPEPTGRRVRMDPGARPGPVSPDEQAEIEAEAEREADEERRARGRRH